MFIRTCLCIYIADKIVQSAESLCILQVVMKKVDIFMETFQVLSKRREFFIYFKVAPRITRLIMTLEFESPYSKRLHKSLLD